MLEAEVKRVCFVMKDREWFSADREMEKVTRLHLLGSYNLVSRVDNSCRPSSVFLTHRFPYQLVTMLKERMLPTGQRYTDSGNVAADSETPELPQQVQPLMGFLVHVDCVVTETEFRVYNCTKVLKLYTASTDCFSCY